VSPVPEFTWSAVSVSGIDAEAMSGGEAFAGFEGVGSASDLFLGFCMVTILRITDRSETFFPASTNFHPWTKKLRYLLFQN
jgi:hypothetical protein